jgi:hypothetical protein
MVFGAGEAARAARRLLHLDGQPIRRAVPGHGAAGRDGGVPARPGPAGGGEKLRRVGRRNRGELGALRLGFVSGI